MNATTVYRIANVNTARADYDGAGELASAYADEIAFDNVMDLLEENGIHNVSAFVETIIRTNIQQDAPVETIARRVIRQHEWIHR